ncbi:MAG TPA: YciI family protein [Solirubrobacteraceae bacterium]
MGEARRLHLLLYDYVEDIVERRAPHREAHLALVARWHDEGRIVIAGATGAPPSGAAIAFAVDDPAEVDAFTDEDPYVAAGLVTDRRVVPWTVVAGG